MGKSHIPKTGLEKFLLGIYMQALSSKSNSTSLTLIRKGEKK
jgi:hypothetical protein